MIITLYNKTLADKHYLDGTVVVPASGSLVVSKDLNVPLSIDQSLLIDIESGDTVFSDSINTFSGPVGREILQSLIELMEDPSSISSLYYSAPINIVQSAATASGSAVWSMRNDVASTKMVFIERISLTSLFTAATVVPGALSYSLCRFSTATPTAGSTITPIKANNLSIASSVTDIRALDTGLTVAGVVFEAPFANLACTSVAGASTTYEREGLAFKLAAGEGMAIRLSSTAVTGLALSGEIIWSER